MRVRQISIAHRYTYTTCVAGVGGAVDIDAGHDRCRRQALAALRDMDADVAALDKVLIALEAEIREST